MTQTQIPGRGLYLPEMPQWTLSATFNSSCLIDATGEKIAFCGPMWRKSHTSGNINKVGFLPGTVVSAGGSGIRVSLQDVSLTAGPMQPDETQDQTVDFLLSALTSNTWYHTAALSASRTVAFGELLAVVVEFDGGGRLGSDSLILKNLAVASSASNQSVVNLKTGGSWTIQSCLNNVILEFDDGTFGTMDDGFPVSNLNTLSYKQDTAVADEHALEFQVPVPCKVDGFWAVVVPSSTAADFDVILYDGTTPMTSGSLSVDAHSVGVASGSMRRMARPFGAEITLAANTTYRLAFKPTQTTANIVLAYFDVNAANHLQAHGGGTTFCLASRIDSGAWAAPVTTRRPFAGIRVSSMDDASGGSGNSPLVGHSSLVGESF